MKEAPLPLRYGPALVRHRKEVDARPEAVDLYQAIVALRHSGRTVYRSGANHKVDGAVLTYQELLRLHAAIPPKDAHRRQPRTSTPPGAPVPGSSRQLSLFG